jgi:hypothetical protein
MNLRWIPLLAVALGCENGKTDGATGPSDTGASGTDDGGGPPDDTGPGEGWLTVPADCTAPEPLPADPLTQALQTEVQGFAHVLEVEHNPGNDRFYVAGIPTLTEWALTDDGITETARFNQEAMDHVAVIDADYVAVSRRGDSEQVGRVGVVGVGGGVLQLVMTIALEDAAGLTAQGDRLYALSGAGTLTTIDISDRSNPAIIHTLEGLGNPWGLVIENSYAVVADNTLGLVIVDVSDPDAPALVGTAEGSGGLQDVVVANGYAYGAAGSRGVEVFSLADPTDPQSVGLVEPGGAIISVAVTGDILWTANQDGVAAIDVSDPEAPVVIGTEATPSWAMGVAATESGGFLAGWNEVALFIADASLQAPDAQPDLSALYFPEGTTEQIIQLSNTGAAPLEIVGLLADIEDIAVAIDRLEVPPGESAQIRVRWLGDGDVAGSLCMATNDPDEPTQTLKILTSNDDSSVLIGEPAPDFSLPGIDGSYYTLSEQVGKPVVLVYFATW